jgi:hypothetical protein
MKQGVTGLSLRNALVSYFEIEYTYRVASVLHTQRRVLVTGSLLVPG